MYLLCPSRACPGAETACQVCPTFAVGLLCTASLLLLPTFVVSATIQQSWPPWKPTSAVIDPVASRPPSVDVGYHTLVGRVRDHNEDSLKVDRDLGLFIVADGMGGHNAGERASQLAVEVLHDFVAGHTDGTIGATELTQAFVQANTAIYEESVEHSERSGMGTTLTALLISGDSYRVAHVGDSRAWLVRDGVGRQVTDDHSVLAEQVRLGVISAEDAARHPMRNVLTRSIGNTPDVEVDVLEGESHPGDIWVLGTDGMTQVMDTERIAEFATNSADADQTARDIVDTACEEDGSDNVTAVVVRCPSG